MRQNRADGGQSRVRPRCRALIAVPVMLGLLVTAGCSAGSGNGPSDDEGAASFLTVPEDAEGAACGDLLGRLPEQVLSGTRNPDNGTAGFASWGDPAVMLSCGAIPTGPTTDECIEVNDVSWVFTETPEHFRFLTYGRQPAVEVQVPTSVERTSATGALVDLNDAVAPLEQTERRCYDLADTMPTPS